MKQNGFTLVELAIVLMIIGLLIGGVLRGQELLENSRVTKTIQQVKAYEGAVTTFRDAYSGMPGDLVTATNRIPGCNAANYCQNGSGNGLLDDGTESDLGWANRNIYKERPETVQFWKHLALAHLITGVNPSANTAPTSCAWGITHPTAPFGGGFEFYYDLRTRNKRSEHTFRMTKGGVEGSRALGQPGTSAVSPIRGYQIDRKMDDGQPSTGFVYANYGAVSDSCKAATTINDARYREGEESSNCEMYFVLN